MITLLTYHKFSAKQSFRPYARIPSQEGIYDLYIVILNIFHPWVPDSTAWRIPWVTDG